MKNLLLITGILNLLSGCKPQGPQPEDMVGIYTVTIQTDTSENDHSLPSTKSESFEFNADSFALHFEKSIENIDDSLVENADTSDMEGKLEYSIQMFGKTMEQFGKGMEDFAEGMGDLGENIALKSKKWKQQLLQNIQFEVELQQDGDCRIKNLDWDFLVLRDAKWEVKSDSFYVLRDKQSPLSFYIEKRNKDKIYLKKEDINVVMTRKE